MAKNKKADAAKEVVVHAADQQGKKKEPLMYIGPTVPGIAIKNRVYEEIPESLKEAIKEVPEYGNLLIPITEYPEAELMLSTGKGYAASAYKKVADLRKGGND